MRLPSALLVVAMTTPLAMTSALAARGDMIPWAYSSDENKFIAQGGTGLITLTGFARQDTAGNQTVTGLLVGTQTTGTVDKPNRVFDLDFTFGLRVLDADSGEAGLVEFAGEFSGPFWATGSALTAVFTDGLRRVLELGDNRYTVTVGDFLAPQATGVADAGMIRVSVSVEAIDGEGPVDPPPPDGGEAPEPATLVALAAGLPFLARFRRRRAAA